MIAFAEPKSFAEPTTEQKRVNAYPSESVVKPIYSTAIEVAVWRTLSWLAPQNVGEIDELEAGYKVLRPIPFDISPGDGGDFIASFAEANIAIGGFDPQDAYQSLVAEILDTLDTLIEQEDELSPAARVQFDVLRTYIDKP